MDPPRWHLRYDNFKRAMGRFDEAILGLRSGNQSLLESEGTIQRFEYTLELAWKTMRDWLGSSGVAVDVASAPNVFRAAFSSGLIDDGDSWVRGMRDRNELSHEYREASFQRVLAAIDATYYPLFKLLEARLQAEYDAGN